MKSRTRLNYAFWHRTASPPRYDRKALRLTRVSFHVRSSHEEHSPPQSHSQGVVLRRLRRTAGDSYWPLTSQILRY